MRQRDPTVLCMFDPTPEYGDNPRQPASLTPDRIAGLLHLAIVGGRGTYWVDYHDMACPISSVDVNDMGEPTVHLTEYGIDVRIVDLDSVMLP